MNRWALLAAAKGEARTKRLLDVIVRLRARGFTLGGVVQESLLAPDGEGGREGYVAHALADDVRIPLARRARGSDEGTGAHLVCSLAFEADALAQVRAWIDRDRHACAVVVIDEVSKLEVAHAGHHDAIVAALCGPALPLLSVRADQLFAVMDRFGLQAPVAALEGESERDLAHFVEELAVALQQEG
jgi:nucleoside-triphosphatase THEP1